MISRLCELQRLQFAILSLLDYVLNGYETVFTRRDKIEIIMQSLSRTKFHAADKYDKPRILLRHLYNSYLAIKKYPTTRVRQYTLMLKGNDVLDMNDMPWYRKKYYRKLMNFLIQHVHQYTSGIFIHGSIATHDYTDFSDIDIGIILKNRVILDYKLMNTVRNKIRIAVKKMLGFDNLQHHGFFYIPECFFRFYPENYLPVDTIERAVAVKSPLKITMRAYRDIDYAKQKLRRIIGAIRGRSGKNISNLYDLKHYLSTCMLLPSLYLQTQDKYLYKKYSFDLIKKRLPASRMIIDCLSLMRQQWKTSGLEVFNALLHFSPNPWLLQSVCRKFFWRMPKEYKYSFDNILYPQIISFIHELGY